MSGYNQPADNETDRQSDLAVMDAEEYKNKRRLKRILDAHDRVEELDNETLARFAAGEIQREGRRILLLRAVKQFIRECYNLINQHTGEVDSPDGYWIAEEPLGRIAMDNDDDVVFWGLKDVLHTDEYYVEKWSETESRRHGPDETESHSEDHFVPEDVSLDAFLLLKEFLEEERGLDLSFRAGTEDVGFDYSDLLEEDPDASGEPPVIPAEGAE